MIEVSRRSHEIRRIARRLDQGLIEDERCSAVCRAVRVHLRQPSRFVAGHGGHQLGGQDVLAGRERCGAVDGGYVNRVAGRGKDHDVLSAGRRRRERERASCVRDGLDVAAGQAGRRGGPADQGSADDDDRARNGVDAGAGDPFGSTDQPTPLPPVTLTLYDDRSKTVPVTFPLVEGVAVVEGPGVAVGVPAPLDAGWGSRCRSGPCRCRRRCTRPGPASGTRGPGGRSDVAYFELSDEPVTSLGRGSRGVLERTREGLLDGFDHSAPDGAAHPGGYQRGECERGRDRRRPDESPKGLLSADGFTEGGFAAYYADVAPLLIPHVARRAMAMKRYPIGLRRILLYEARRRASAAVARDVPRRAPFGQRHRLPDGR